MISRLFALCVATQLLAVASFSTMLSTSVSKFAQSKFTQSKFTQSKFTKPQKSTNKFGSDSRIGSLHRERVATAGRIGTKRFVNPCLVYIGNLPFNTTESVLENWISEKLGLPATVWQYHLKVVRHWQHDRASKGYAFCHFTQALYATVCIEKCNNKLLDGRPLTVLQGKKKEQEGAVYIKNSKNNETTAVASVEDAIVYMEPSEIAMWKRLDPDLVADVVIQGDEPEIKYASDDELFDNDDDDDDDGIDGVWEDEEDEVIEFDETQKLNREQRREAVKAQGKKKLPHKGFG